MTNKLIKKYFQFLFSKNNDGSSDNARTAMLVKNSSISFITKGITILFTLITVPIVYNHLDKYQFGVYVTLTSIISWIDMFDFGINEGVRNRITEAIVDRNTIKVKKLISTAYVLLAIIAISVLLVYICLYRFINWQTILNATILDRNLLDLMALIVIGCFLVRFTFSVINKVFLAFQKSYLVDVNQLFSKILYLIGLLILVSSGKVTLFNVAVLQSLLSALVPIAASLYFFIFIVKEYRPSIRLIDFSISGQILGLGWQFFIIQISLLVIHSGNNILISQFVDPASVPAYSLSYQLFSYVLLAYTIIITPLWSAYTEAWRMNRISWIWSTIKKIKKIFFLFVICSIFVVILTPIIFKYWIGEKADVPMVMALSVATMVLLDMWIRIYDFFLNGIGKIRVQLIVNVSMAIVNIPLAYIFSVVCNLNAVGVVLASIISYSISAIISPLQTNLILNGKAKGIWNK